MKKQRLTFKCWQSDCRRNYQLTRDLSAGQVLMVACPYCGSEAQVALEPFRKETKTVMRGDEAEIETYVFPDPIPTQKPE